jgi:phage terminase large subunit-like protein
VRATSLSGLLEELLAFPHYRSDDQVEPISQALTRIQQRRRFRNADVDIGMPISIPKEHPHFW